ncbi:unnamed protein product [Amoebophrya sp. A25]|nr:unnamed protein product [Amoebophrya sp. A25]|eukprot:GSA25T00004207001.1
MSAPEEKSSSLPANLSVNGSPSCPSPYTGNRQEPPVLSTKETALNLPTTLEFDDCASHGSCRSRTRSRERPANLEVIAEASDECGSSEEESTSTTQGHEGHLQGENEVVLVLATTAGAGARGTTTALFPSSRDRTSSRERQEALHLLLAAPSDPGRSASRGTARSSSKNGMTSSPQESAPPHHGNIKGQLPGSGRGDDSARAVKVNQISPSDIRSSNIIAQTLGADGDTLVAVRKHSKTSTTSATSAASCVEDVHLQVKGTRDNSTSASGGSKEKKKGLPKIQNAVGAPETTTRTTTQKNSQGNKKRRRGSSVVTAMVNALFGSADDDNDDFFPDVMCEAEDCPNTNMELEEEKENNSDTSLTEDHGDTDSTKEQRRDHVLSPNFVSSEDNHSTTVISSSLGNIVSTSVNNSRVVLPSQQCLNDSKRPNSSPHAHEGTSSNQRLGFLLSERKKATVGTHKHHYSPRASDYSDYSEKNRKMGDTDLERAEPPVGNSAEVAPVLLAEDEEDLKDYTDIEASMQVFKTTSELSSGGHQLSTGRISMRKTVSVFQKQKTWQDPRAEFITHQVRLIVPPTIVFVVWCVFRATGGCFFETSDIISAFRTKDAAKAVDSDVCRLLTTEGTCIANTKCGWHESKEGWVRTDFRCDIKELEDIKNFRFVFPSVTSGAIWESWLLLFFLNYGGIWILLKIWRVMPRQTFWMWRALFLIIQPTVFSFGFLHYWKNGNYDSQWVFRAVCTAALPFAFSAVAGASWGYRPPKGMWPRIFRASFYILTMGLYFLMGIAIVESGWVPWARKFEKEDATAKKILLDFFLVYVGFSFYMPLGATLVARQYLRLTKMVAMEIHSRRARESFLACARACFNVVLDMFRFAYGRSVLLRVHPVVFACTLSKDVCSDFWVFAFKYQESLQVFLMKLDQNQKMSPADMELNTWQTYAVHMVNWWRKLNRCGIDSVICWWVSFDCDRENERSAHILTVDEVKRQASVGDKNRRASLSMSQVLTRRVSTASDDDVKYKRRMTFGNTRMIADNVPKFPRVKGCGIRGLGDVPSRYLFPVTDDEVELVMPLMEFWQKEVFVRFQVRMAAKLFTSVGVAIAIALSVQSNTAFLPGYPRDDGDLVGKPSLDLRFVAYILALMIADGFTWCLITLKVHLRGVKSWTESLGQFQDLFSWDEDVIFRMFWGNGLYFLVLLMAMMMGSHNEKRLQYVTGVDDLTADHLREVCSNHF